MFSEISLNMERNPYFPKIFPLGVESPYAYSLFGPTAILGPARDSSKQSSLCLWLWLSTPNGAFASR